ncbi:hypothetical protein IW262DRAFT_1293504 [Armillaria fumosa]|nr:hypothetical protein IW262DRAFT_1293504 [Armillaria fumosa]
MAHNSINKKGKKWNDNSNQHIVRNVDVQSDLSTPENCNSKDTISCSVLHRREQSNFTHDSDINVLPRSGSGKKEVESKRQILVVEREANSHAFRGHTDPAAKGEIKLDDGNGRKSNVEERKQLDRSEKRLDGGEKNNVDKRSSNVVKRRNNDALTSSVTVQHVIIAGTIVTFSPQASNCAESVKNIPSNARGNKIAVLSTQQGLNKFEFHLLKRCLGEMESKRRIPSRTPMLQSSVIGL